MDLFGFSRTATSPFATTVMETCHQSGCTPNIVREALTYDEMLDAISTGVGAGFVKESTANCLQMKGVLFRELKDARVTVEFGIAHRRDKSSRALRAFLQVLAELSDCNQRLPPELGAS